MERRCKILENCHALLYNSGRGEVIEHLHGVPVKYTDTRYLRSILFKMMEVEVLNFCARKDTAETSHQQVNIIVKITFFYKIMLTLHS